MGITPSPPVRVLPDVNKQPIGDLTGCYEHKWVRIAEGRNLKRLAGTGYVLVLHALFR